MSHVKPSVKLKMNLGLTTGTAGAPPSFSPPSFSQSSFARPPLATPPRARRRSCLTLVLTLALPVLLGGCNALTRLSEVGDQPKISAIENPAARPSYRPVSMPMPDPESVVRSPNSLWRSGARAFFKDQRAVRVGDILTVMIEIEDEAQINNSTTRSRSNADSAGIGGLFGYESSLNQILPDAVNPSRLVDLSSTLSNQGAGKIDRDESIKLKLAAVVTQVLPNGNMVLHGRQEVRVNFEVRELQIAGIVRPEDIKTDNTIAYDKIAEARISYGGRGHISDVQQPRYGSQVLDIFLPF